MFKKTILTLILINLLLAAYFYRRPYSFYKVVAIRSVNDFNKIIQSDTVNKDDYILKTIIELPERPGSVYTHNKEKRIKLFKQGIGNCSNQSVALGTMLGEYKKRFQVIHMMPIFQFLEGSGHSILQTTFNDTLMIIDVLGRSILKKENHLINFKDLDSLTNNSSNQPMTFQILNRNRGSVELFYNPDSIENVILGIVPDDEYRKFYAFTKYLYTPEKESKLTQAFFYSITTLFNKLPHIYVQEKDFKKLNQYNKFKLDRLLSYTLVVNTWIIIFLLVLYLLNKLNIKMKR